MADSLRDRWGPVYRPPESPYTRSGRVLNPAPGGWYAAKGTQLTGRPWMEREACERYCDLLNEAEPTDAQRLRSR